MLVLCPSTVRLRPAKREVGAGVPRAGRALSGRENPGFRETAQQGPHMAP